jgi:hypothetical protein
MYLTDKLTTPSLAIMLPKGVGQVKTAHSEIMKNAFRRRKK